MPVRVATVERSDNELGTTAKRSAWSVVYDVLYAATFPLAYWLPFLPEPEAPLSRRQWIVACCAIVVAVALVVWVFVWLEG